MTDRDPLDLAYADGWIARREGKGLDANPYQGGPLLPARIVCHPAIRSAWIRGWQAHDAAIMDRRIGRGQPAQ